MAQFIEATDAFTEGSPAYGESPNRWINLRPFTTNPVYTSGGVGMGTAGFTGGVGIPYTGWWVGSTRPVAFGIRDGLVASNPPVSNLITNAQAGGNVCGAIARGISVADVRVEAAFENLVTSAAGQENRQIEFGIGARITGGTLTDEGTHAERIIDSSGYWFFRTRYMNASSQLGYKWVLVRVDAGTITRLAEDPVGETVYNPISDLRSSPAIRMWMEVETVGGNVEINCYREILGVSVGADPEALVLSYTDTSASKIVVAGGVAFGCRRDMQTAGISFAGGCTMALARALGGATLIREEWDRINIIAGRQIGHANDNTITGREVQSGYYGGTYGNPQYNGVLKRDAGSNRLVVDPVDVATVTDYAFFTSQRAADSSTTQRRSIIVRFDLAGSTNPPARAGGVALRVSHPGAVQLPEFAYTCELERVDATGDGRFVIARIASGVRVELAEIAISPVDLSTDYTVELFVTHEGSVTVGAALITGYIGGVKQNVALVAGVPAGVTVSNGGVVRDASSSRIQSGLAESFFVYLPGGDKKVMLDLWTDVAALGPETENNHASIVIASDAAGATGTLTIPLDWPVEELFIEPHVGIRFESDHEYTSPATHKVREGWRVQAFAEDAVAVAALRAFWTAHGNVIPFNWTTDHGEDVVVIFRDERMSDRKRGPNTYGYAFDLIQVFE